MLGRFLEKKGYTSHAPIYRGHGLPPEELLKTNPDEWWEDVLQAFRHLRDLGYEEIAVAGLSLGGALGLKLAYLEPVKAVIPMCTPIFFDNEERLTVAYKGFAKEYKQLEQKDPQTIEQEVSDLVADSVNMFQEIGKFINDVRDNVDTIYTPTDRKSTRLDQIINRDSAPYIHEHVEADHKQIK